MAPILEILEVKLKVFIEACFDCFLKLGLVVLEADHEIATAIDDVQRAISFGNSMASIVINESELDLLQ